MVGFSPSCPKLDQHSINHALAFSSFAEKLSDRLRRLTEWGLGTTGGKKAQLARDIEMRRMGNNGNLSHDGSDTERVTLVTKQQPDSSVLEVPNVVADIDATG